MFILISNFSHSQICQAVLKDLQKCAIEKRLVSFEVPQKVYLDADIWTPETGLVTDALKLKRINLQQRFQSEIDRMYNRGSLRDLFGYTCASLYFPNLRLIVHCIHDWMEPLRDDICGLVQAYEYK
ncbi:unnamed protein product [Protopolystoma xenopodis]|uniref:AMP-binding enzyme C-terminal domain-containing protein n=1 Tax=Protopolystoma xenopodis TaxID=117903 RepID=A0A3S5B7B4_9PLAT|nr:unnamed protein product [Protopolystoma xenopodis]